MFQTLQKSINHCFQNTEVLPYEKNGFSFTANTALSRRQTLREANVRD